MGLKNSLTVGNSSWSKILNLRFTAKTASCSSSLGTVDITFFIGASHDLDITNEQTGLLLPILMCFATAPYTIVEVSQKTCKSTSLLFSLRKPNHLFNNILVMFSKSCFHTFHCANNWCGMLSSQSDFFSTNFEWFLQFQ